jgi:protein-disulfide isomerase
VKLPMNVDPNGKLEAKVDADKQLGINIGIKHTPTIYVVSDKKQGQPFVEVVDRTNLFSQIDQMIAEAGGTRETTKRAKASGAGAR